MRIEFTKDDENIPSKFLDDGVFTCRITKVEAKPTKKGDPMVELEFTEVSSMKTVRDWFVLAAGFNKFKLLQLVKAAGLNPQGFDTEQLQGKTVTVTRRKTGEREYNSKVYPDYETEYSSAAKGNEESIPF